MVSAHTQTDTDYLPRLFNVIRASKQDITTPVFLIDTGQACDDDHWLCQATENRAPYFILDAMGYNAAFADGLRGDAWQQAQPHMQLRLIPAGATAVLTYQDSLRFRVRADAESDQPIIDGNVLVLPLPQKNTLLCVEITTAPMKIVKTWVKMVDDNTLPNPTIVGAIEFVDAEARYYLKRRGASQ